MVLKNPPTLLYNNCDVCGDCEDDVYNDCTTYECVDIFVGGEEECMAIAGTWNAIYLDCDDYL